MPTRSDLAFSRDGEAFHYIDWGGEGPVAHIAHATGFCAATYTPLAERLRPYLKILGMDDRGHGSTQAEAVPRDLRDWNVFSEDLAHLFRHVGEPVIAIGHSRGGVASLLVAVRHPELVRALVLIDPTILPFSWMWWWYLAKKTGLSKRVPIAARAAKRKRAWPDRETVQRAYKAKEPFFRWQPGFLEGYLADGVKENAKGRAVLSCDPAWESRCFAVCPHDVWRYVPRLRLPTLVLYGTDSDTFLAPAVKRFKRKVPDAMVLAFQGATHFVPMERPGECAEAVVAFLKHRRVL